MPNLFRSAGVAEWASAALVVVASLIVGYEASLGMTAQQWAGGAIAVLGSISVAVMVRVWPAAAADAERRRAE